MNKYICEFSGTFFLVLTVGSTVINGAAGVIGPLDIDSMLMLLAHSRRLRESRLGLHAEELIFEEKAKGEDHTDPRPRLISSSKACLS